MVKSEPLDSIQHKILAIFFGLLVFILSLNSVFASTFTASIDSTQVVIGERFNLKLSIDTISPSFSPDLSPLTKDFDIVGTSQTSQTKIVNGSRTESFSWIVTLSAKTTGNLQIPGLSNGNLTSQPLAIEVLKTAATPSQKQKTAGLSINIDINSDSHYIHEEFPMTITIIDGLGIQSATLSEYTGDDFLLKQSGEDKVTQVNHNGQPVNKIERTYLVKPLSSGELTFPALTLNARVYDKENKNTIFGNNDVSKLFNQFGMGASIFDSFMNPGREISATSEPIQINIKSRPISSNEWFLPAKDVQLLASFNTDNPEFKVGEAVTRKIQLYALGASKEQLPELVFENTDGVTIYVDKTDERSMRTANGTAAIREYVTSIIPTRPGEINLPAMEVKWWDTQSDSEKTTTLAAEKYIVQGSAITTTDNHDKASKPQKVKTQTGENLAENLAENQNPVTQEFSSLEELPGIYTFVSLIIALSVIAVLLLHMKRSQDKAIDLKSQKTQQQTGKLTQHVSTLFVEIELACLCNDAQKAYANTLKLLSVKTDSIRGIHKTPDTVTSAVTDELKRMEALLYSDESRNNWKGDTLLMAIKKYKKHIKKNTSTRDKNVLQPLYPITSQAHQAI